MNKYQEALNKLCSRCYVESDECTCHARYQGGKCYETCDYKSALQELVDKHNKLEKIFGDRHICEIKTRFNEIECNADRCDGCPLAIGDDMCLKITFEDKWQFQEERDNLNKYKPRNYKVMVRLLESL